jgi:hypothetical protein
MASEQAAGAARGRCAGLSSRAGDAVPHQIPANCGHASARLATTQRRQALRDAAASVSLSMSKVISRRGPGRSSVAERSPRFMTKSRKSS